MGSSANEKVLLEESRYLAHIQALVQWILGCLSALGGLVCLAIVTYRAVTDGTLEKPLPALSAAAMLAVAVMFFNQSNGTRQRLHDQLKADEKKRRAMCVAGKLRGPLGAAVCANVALHLAGVKTEKLDINELARSVDKGWGGESSS